MPDPMAPPVPDVSQLPPTSTPNPGAPPIPNQAVAPAQDQVDQQHSVLGRGIRHLASALEGKQISYEPDPTTGQAKEVVTPRRPGGLFRDMILGAIAGGAAGAPKKGEYNSGAAGLFKGAQGAMDAQQQAQQKAQQQAQQKAQVQKQQNDQKEAEDKAAQLAAQTTAMTTANSIQYAGNIDLHNPDNVQKHNLVNDTITDQVLKAGGNKPVVLGPDGQNINGKPGNGPTLMKMYNTDPSIMQAPEGFHRVPLFHFDNSDMDHEVGKGYSKDGQSVDPNDHASVSFIDVPNSAWGKSVTLTKGQVNDIAGSQLASGKDSDTVSTSLGSLFSLHLKNIQQMNQQHADVMTPPKSDDDAAGMAAKVAAINADPNASSDEKHWASVKQTMLDARDKYKANQLKTEAAARTEGKEGEFPVLKEGDVGGYIANAQRVASDPNSTPEQKAQAQKQLQYGQSAAKTIQNTATSLAAAKKSAEVIAENNQIDKNAKGAVALPSAYQKRFADLPAPLQSQLADKRTSDIAAVFGVADGDMPANTFPNRVYKGSTQLSQSEAMGLVKQINPEYSAQLYTSKQKLLNNYTDSKREGGQIETFNNFLNHAADASDVVNNWRTTNIPLLNMPMNKVRDQVGGSSAYTQLVAALEPVKKEYMSFLNSNRAEHTDDIDVMQKILKDTATPAQIQEGLKQLSNTAVLRLDSLNQNWKNLTGGNYPNLLTPKGKEAAAKLGQGAQVADYGSGGTLNASSMRQTTPSAPSGASAEVYAADGKTLLGHIVNGHYVALGK